MRRLLEHLRWRLLQARRAYRVRLFELAGRYRNVIRTRDHHGNTLFISTGDQEIGRAVFVHGHFEATTITLALDLLAARGLEITKVLDIGANIGTTTIEILTLLPHATAECFEPEPFNHWLLTRNLAANGLHRARAHELALSDVDGTVEFELSDANAGDHRVRMTEATGEFGEASRQTRSVPARRFDGLGIPVDGQTLAYVDVQGHEWNVLAGAASLTGPVVVEFWPYVLERAGTLDALIARLDGMGTVLDLTDGGRETDRAGMLALGANRDPYYIRDLLVVPDR